MSDVKNRLCGLVGSKSSGSKGSLKQRTVKKQENDEKSPQSRIERHFQSSISSHSQRNAYHSKSDRSHVSGRHSENNHTPEPLTSWPPSGFAVSDKLSPDRAKEIIMIGTPAFCGHKLPITHSGKEFYHLFATHFLNGFEDREQIEETEDHLMNAASLRLQGFGSPVYPWETLEQPSMALYYGSRPGTISLNHWVNLSSRVPNADRLLEAGFKPREVTLPIILERLIHLENGMEDVEEENMKHRNIYRNLLRIPEIILGPHRAMDKQINDLAKDLSRQCWVDFSKKENQVVAKYFLNATYNDSGQYKLFFHQLLLAIELDLRIQKCNEETKTDILRNLPEKVKWDLALARRWRSNVSIESFKPNNYHQRIRFHLRKKKEQLKNLYIFAETLKWPNFCSLGPIFSELAVEIENISADTMTYFTSVILPGPTLSFLMMNSLIEINSLSSPQPLVALSHLYPNIGFQYRGATFWNSNCIVGKVLAPSCKEIGGWIGPVRPAEGLDLTQVARVRQKAPKRKVEDVDVVTMNERSLPLGPVAKNYPMIDYALLQPNNDPDSIVDNIRIEKLSLRPISSLVSLPESEKLNPRLFDACIQFAVDGASWRFSLACDVSFVSACPCKGGPHPNFFDYEYHLVAIDAILTIKEWAGRSKHVPNSSVNNLSSSAFEQDSSGNVSNQFNDSVPASRNSQASIADDEKVLVIEAFGVVDNEVLARSWCADWGLSALVADVRNTCMACANREAFAACLNVLILIDSSYIGCDEDD